MSRRWVRWMPAAVMPALVAGFVLAGPLQAAAPPDLPAKTAGQLLEMIASSHVTALSGTVQQTVNLGLPQLPSAGLAPGPSGEPAQPGTGSAGPLSPANISGLVSLLTTPHTARVYMDGATQQRIQLLDKLAERNLIRNGGVLWSYDSATNAVVKYMLPDGAKDGANSGAKEGAKIPGLPGSPVLTPADLAAKLLANIDPTTELTVGTATRVAHRPAYVLELQRRTVETLIGTISVAVDSATGLPLSVAVQSSRDRQTAFEVAFSQVTLAAPPPSVFAFTPPAGATVTERGPADHPRPAKTLAGAAPSTAPPVVAPSTIGTGWGTIIHAPSGTVQADLANNPALSALLHQVTGGQALETTLFTVLITPDGSLLAGAVPLAALQSAARQPAAAGK